MSPKAYLITTLALLGIAASYTFYNETRPNPDLLRFEAIDNRAYGFGYTNDRSVSQVARFINDNPQVDTLVLKSMSGTHNSVANLRIARRIRNEGLATHLESDSMIASGAVDLFLAGNQRTMECGAMIGVHSWRDNYGRTGQDKAMDLFKRMHENFLTDMGHDPAFYSFTRAAAPASSIHWMSMEEIRRFDLLTTYPHCGE